MARRTCGDLSRRSLGDNSPAVIACVRPKVNHPISRLDHVEIVLDDPHGMARVHQPLKNLEQHADVVEVQAGGGFVEKK
jgi:hypothetical protein